MSPYVLYFVDTRCSRFFNLFQPVIVRIERLSIFVAAGGSTGSRPLAVRLSLAAGLPPASGRSQLQKYWMAFYRSGLVVPMSQKNLEYRVIENSPE